MTINDKNADEKLIIMVDPINQEKPQEQSKSKFASSEHREQTIEDEPRMERVQDEETASLRNVSIQDVVTEWTGGTSVHGVALAADYHHYAAWFRSLWVMMIVTAAGVMIWQITSLIQEYRAYDVITEVETIVPESLEFPDVTLCNFNLYSKSLRNMTGITYPRNEQELLDITQPIDEFILRSTFNGVPLDMRNWTVSFGTLGVCAKFSTEERVYLHGIYAGLRADLFLNQDEYEGTPGFGYAGLVVYVTQKGVEDNRLVPFTVVAPGGDAFVSLERHHFEREKEAPWARCHSQAPEYTQTGCKAKCLNKAIVEQCGCRHFSDSLHPEVDFCADRACEQSIQVGKELVKCNSQAETDCTLPPCDITLYPATSIRAEFSRATTKAFDKDREASDFSGIYVNYASIIYREFSESKAVTFAQLLGGVGGSMGLFLGISALSVVEVFGDFFLLRLLPRFFGYRHMYGLGAVATKHE
uniref:Uncharacterized protein n=1 Tax=Entomoneis paludosa TaxID=265537 RepID=A0A7S2YJ66_9STRA|mmetsp:Transcript_349/g.872  ORF Transcript_349/g.872 Transcript_349/m.872 type:complete len:472 (+) Transcript_349:190-1605(+)